MSFLWNQIINTIYPNEENEFVAPNHSKKGDYNVNLSLSNWKWNFNSKNFKKSYFFAETKASISFIPMRRLCFWCRITKKKEIILWICVYPTEKWTLIPIMVERDVFFWNQRLHIIYPNEENILMVPNHERKGDYYVNWHLSKSTNKY